MLLQRNALGMEREGSFVESLGMFVKGGIGAVGLNCDVEDSGHTDNCCSGWGNSFFEAYARSCE